MRKLASSFLIITICILSFVMPFLKASQISYAAGDVSSWYQVTTTEQAAEAFRYYCKSRDLTIEGSALDAVTSFTTKMYTDLCNGVGLNMDAIQADLKYTTDSNGKVKFLINKLGITAFNRLFAQLLHDYDLEEGDTNVNKLVHSGLYFTDADGITCEVFDCRGSTLGSFNKSNTNYGSFYKYDTDYITGLLSDHENGYSSTLTFKCSEITTVNQTFKFFTEFNASSHWRTNVYTANNSMYFVNGCIFWESIDYASDNTTITKSTVAYYGYPCVARLNDVLYFGIYTCHDPANGQQNDSITQTVEIKQGNTQNADIYFISTTINNNDYSENTYTTINEEGDTNNYYIDTEPDPDDPIGPDPGPGPDPGGGYNPYPGGGGTTTDPDQTGGGDGDDDTTITFPNFNFDLPSINWSLGDLSEKFPFSIPFDLIAFFTVLNAEPEAPAIDANIPLGDWYTWNFKADFSQFDNYAVIVRNVEFIAFCVGLIYLTIKFVKG